MDNFWVTYSGVVGSSAKVEASLLKMSTLCKLINNQMVGCDSAASGFASALHWAHLLPWL